MATYEQTMQALRQAHNAGNTQEAARLAQIATALKNAPSSMPPGAATPAIENAKTKASEVPTTPEEAQSSLENWKKSITNLPNAAQRFGVGLTKPIIGIAEMVTDPFAKMTGRENLARKAGDWAMEKEKQLMQESGQGPDAWNIAGGLGELFSPLPGGAVMGGGKLLMKGAAHIPGATTAVGKAASHIPDALKNSPLAKNAAIGGAFGLATPEGTAKPGQEDNFWGNKLEGGLAGAITGGALGKAAQLATNPIVSQQVQKLKEAGIRNLTPGQLAHDIPLLGKGINALEKAATSFPLTGAMVRGSLKKADDEFTVASMNKALKPLGQEIGKKEVKDAHDLNEVYGLVHKKIGDAYTKIEPNISFSNMPNKGKKGSKQFGNEITDHINGKDSPVFSTMKKDEREALGEHLKDVVTGRMEKGKLDGPAFRRVEQDLNAMKKSFYGKGEHQQAQAVDDVLQMMRDRLEKQNPAVGKELRNIHAAYRNSLPLEKAIATAGLDAAGSISPAQLVRGTKSVEGQRSAAMMTAPSYDLAKTASDVFGPRMGTSFTSERTAGMDLLKKVGLGGAESAGYGAAATLLSPAFLAPLGLTASIYNPLSQRLINKAATERPEFVKKLSPAAQKAAAATGGTSGGEIHKDQDVPMARGGLVAYADGGEIEEAAPALGAADKYLQRRLLMQPAPAPAAPPPAQMPPPQMPAPAMPGPQQPPMQMAKGGLASAKQAVLVSSPVLEEQMNLPYGGKSKKYGRPYAQATQEFNAGGLIKAWAAPYLS